MDTKYQTTDGTVFNSEGEARRYQDKLDIERAQREARATARREELYAEYNQMVRAFNAQNWDEVIEQKWVADSDYTYRMYQHVLPYSDINKVMLLAGIAQANRDNDYEAAFEVGWATTYASESEKLCPAAIEAGQKAWERKNGRAISQNELDKFHIKYLELKMAGRLICQKDAKTIFAEGLVTTDKDVQEWMRLTGKKLTWKDQKRINGKLFLDNKKRLRAILITVFSVIVIIIYAIQFSVNGLYVEPDSSNAGYTDKLAEVTTGKLAEITTGNEIKLWDGLYEGDLVNKKPHGKGKLIYKSGNVYEGDFVNGKRQGSGIMRFADGDIYEGEYVNDKRHGKGKYTWPSGGVYEGEYVKGKEEGKGKYTSSDGNVREGIYKNGKYLRAVR